MVCPDCRKAGELSRTARQATDAGVSKTLTGMAQKAHKACPELRRQADETLTALIRKASALCDCAHELVLVGR